MNKKVEINAHKILIIDDDINTIDIVVDILEKANPVYIFYHAVNGEMGVEAAEKHQPHLIITDWEMDGGISGIETIRKLKLNPATAKIPVIMLTGIMTSTKNLKTALDAGAVDFIRKPIDEIELVARIRSMLMLAGYFRKTIQLQKNELAATAMNALKDNQFNLKILDKLKVIEAELSGKSDARDELVVIKRELKSRVKNEAWVHFEKYFQQVHPRFVKNLLEEYANLTPAEIRLATFLRLNLSSKDISSILFLTVNSIKTARARLRKKLNLKKEDNVTSFLLRF